ncbi:MAG: restriction endonuclease subunit S [Microscillaceae bacterium]|jgi:restriction endonuclease S subunit|nr:restriction endonuclease subunit S [Microscillaceae bacterium]
MRGALEGRLEPFYYIPEIVDLENKVRKIANGKLRDYILKIASGATPSVKEEEKFYSDAENGIPFIRVQNLSPTNELQLDDLKYINIETHENYLKRSQVTENDLLIKITGVGRMAVASVAPKDFIGNTNQHLVVIKTKDRLISEAIATFLNTDIGEKLASRRSTGGTRPALDYGALKSIPIVYNPQIIDIVKKAVLEKKAKEAQAQALLAGIDAYLLDKLGISPLAPEGETKDKTFFVKFSQVQGKRFDPFYHKKEFEELKKNLENSVYKIDKIKNLCYNVSGVIYSNVDEANKGIKILRANNINLHRNELDLSDIRYIRNDFEIKDEQRLRKNDIFMCAASGSKEHSGKVAFIDEDLDCYFGGFMMVLRCFNLDVSSRYVFEILASSIFRKYLMKILGGTNINNLNFSMFKNFQIPLPPLEIQIKIAEHISQIRAQAQALEAEAKLVLEQAKQVVEKMILGK